MKTYFVLHTQMFLTYLVHIVSVTIAFYVQAEYVFVG